MQFWALIVDSFRESLDRKIFWVLVVISVAIAASMACVGIEGEHISFFFGAWEIETGEFNPLMDLGRSRLVGVVVYLLMDLYVGWVGVVLMIIATAGVFPALMEHGAIDVVLSKPISRYRLFLYKYLTSMVFVLLQALLFVGLTFLVMGFRWGVWVPGYLMAIPLLVLLFSYVYCISVLVSVRTRSTVAAILLSIIAWIMYVTPTIALQTFDTWPSLKEHQKIYRMMQVVAWIPPKTAEIPYIAARWAGAGTSVDIFPDSVVGDNEEDRRNMADARAIEQKELDKNPYLSIGSSLLFEAVIVLWAMQVFARKDY